MKSIKTKLILYFSVLILLSSISLGLISLLRASKIVTSEAEKSLASLSYDASKLTASRIQTQLASLKMIAHNDYVESMDWKLQQPLLRSQKENTNFLDLIVVLPDGTAYYSNGTTGNLGDKGYVKKALKGEANISDLEVSSDKKEIVLMYATPIEKDGKVLGVLLGKRNGDSLSQIADDTGFGENGYGYVVNSSGTVVGHPNRDMVFSKYNPIEGSKSDESQRSVAELLQKAISEKTGASEYSFKGKELYAGYAPVDGTNWTFIITADQSEVLVAIPELQKAMLIVLAAVLVVSIIITYIIGNSIAKPIIKTIQHSETMASLDITKDIPESYLKKKDEIGDLSRALQSITNSLRDIIKEISNSSEQVSAASEELTATSQQSATSAEEVSRTVEEISVGSLEQARNTEEGSLKATLLGASIEKDQSYVKDLNAATSKVSEVVDEGLSEIDNLSKITEESNSRREEIYEVILKTNDSSNKIGQASNVIASIAEQTNLLALNAAIEAARAGEAGKGFAVVAEEIRKLAEQSSTSTEDINQMVNELQNNAHEAVNAMEKLSEITKEQTDSVISSKGKYLLIAEAMKESEITVDKLNASGAEMEKTKDEIFETLKKLSSIAEENAAATEEVTASMEEQAASIEEIAGSSESLSELAQNLQSIIMKFKF